MIARFHELISKEELKYLIIIISAEAMRKSPNGSDSLMKNVMGDQKMYEVQLTTVIQMTTMVINVDHVCFDILIWDISQSKCCHE